MTNGIAATAQFAQRLIFGFMLGAACVAILVLAPVILLGQAAIDLWELHLVPAWRRLRTRARA